MEQLISGVYMTPLKIIEAEKGNVLHVLKNSDESYKGFGEAYFSTVNFEVFKGWKMHQEMTLNIVVPTGIIQFYFLHQAKENGKISKATAILSQDNYFRLTVEPGIWMGFKGLGKELNLLLNIASIPHNPSEAINAQSDFWMKYFD